MPAGGMDDDRGACCGEVSKRGATMQTATTTMAVMIDRAIRAGDEPGARAVRYHWAPGMPEREVIAYPATFALVARMADSLAEALRPDTE